MRSGRFQKFDYGVVGNLVHYVQVNPPPYNLAKIPATANMLMISGGQDALADSRDLERLEDELKCPVHALVLPSYGHADFVVGTRANVDVYDPLIQYFLSL